MLRKALKLRPLAWVRIKRCFGSDIAGSGSQPFHPFHLTSQVAPDTQVVDQQCSIETIAIYVYRLAFQYFKTSESTALAYILLFIVIVLTNLYLYFVKRRAQEA
jgi:ABC-type sugar transport system permease subunit